jgi:transcription initiation factor IIE alpha subunit
MNAMFGNSISYSCINCGTRHNEIACPKCGSKMKRADFHRYQKIKEYVPRITDLRLNLQQHIPTISIY